MTLAGTSNLPVAPKNTPWHASAAKQRVLEACDGTVACISRAFLWRSDGDPREAESWHLCFCDVIDGRLHIVPKGIAAAAGVRGLGSFAVASSDRAQIQFRITAIYDRVRRVHSDWPISPFANLTADASGTPLEGTIALEGTATGDGRFIRKNALTWDSLPVPLVFDRAEMDHSGATIGTINEIERREGGVIWARGALSDSSDPETQMLVARAEELFAEGAVGVSVSLDDVSEDCDDEMNCETETGRIRSVAIVDEAAFAEAKMGLVASSTRMRAVKREWFKDPIFGLGSTHHQESNGDERLVWQEPERDEEEPQWGCPLTITEDGHIFGHAALWYRCHVGYSGSCVRPPKEPASYRGYLTGERIPGIPTGPLVMGTRHAPNHLDAAAAAHHYDHTGYAPADITLGPDAYGIWVSGALRLDATEAQIEVLRASALSGDWRPVGSRHRLIGVLAVNGPGFRIARALAASSSLITVGPGCDCCDDQLSLEDVVQTLAADMHTIKQVLAQGLVAGVKDIG